MYVQKKQYVQNVRTGLKLLKSAQKSRPRTNTF